jgi:uncharacterized membrane protein YcaP (DUF421 family)
MTSLLSCGKIMLSCLVIYLFIIVAIRLFGKKELSQLSVLDLVFVLLISNSVQNAMVGPDATLMGGLVAATTLFAVNYIFKWAMYKFPKFSKTIQGHPQLLIYNGKLMKQNLDKLRLSKAELEEAIREHGENSISEIDLAVLEVDGHISLHSGGFSKHSLSNNKD